MKPREIIKNTLIQLKNYIEKQQLIISNFLWVFQAFPEFFKKKLFSPGLSEPCKRLRQKLIYLENENSFPGEIKSFLSHLKGFRWSKQNKFCLDGKSLTLRYCKNIANFLFWVLWTLPSKPIMTTCRNFDVYLHACKK